MVAQVAVADDPQFAAGYQGCAGLLEHTPGEKVANHLLLVERRIAQHQVQRVSCLLGQAIAGADFGRALAQRCTPVFLGRLHRHVGLIHQRQLGLRAAQRIGNTEHAVAAAEVGDTHAAEVFGQVREEGAGADIQVFTAEHIGVVKQLDSRLVQTITRWVRRHRRRLGFMGGKQQAGFFHRQRGLHRADVFFQQVAGGAWQVLDHRGGNHLRVWGELAVQANQLLLQQRQGFRHADQHHVEWPLGDRAGRHEPHGIYQLLVAQQVDLQAQVAEVRVAAAGHLRLACQADGQGAEAVIQHQYPRAVRQPLLMQVVEQVFVGGIEGLQRLVGLVGLAKQVELGERGTEHRHGKLGVAGARARSKVQLVAIVGARRRKVSKLRAGSANHGCAARGFAEECRPLADLLSRVRYPSVSRHESARSAFE